MMGQSSMRDELLRLLLEEMEKDDSLFLLVGDLGLGKVEIFQEKFPDRYLNVGIAEQNLIGVSAGLCNVGYRPFCYTHANFITQRCYEQIRDDICIHKHPITLIGNSTGFDNGLLGPTHQSIDDIGCIKILPNIDIYSPSSIGAIRLVFNDVMRNRNPAYIRVSKTPADVDCDDINSMVRQSDSDILIVTHGSCLINSLESREDVDIFNMNRIKPLGDIKDMLESYNNIIVVEDNFASSGLYNSICQYMMENDITGIKVHHLGPKEEYSPVVGDRAYFEDIYGYSANGISKFIQELRK